MQFIEPEDFIIDKYYVVIRENSTDEFIFKYAEGNNSPYIGGKNTGAALSNADFKSYCGSQHDPRKTKHATPMEISWLDRSIAEGVRLKEPKIEMYEIY